MGICGLDFSGWGLVRGAYVYEHDSEPSQCTMCYEFLDELLASQQGL